MFVELQKITTAAPSQNSPIIVNKDAILILDSDSFENKELGNWYQATRVEVSGFPKYTFHTLTPLITIALACGVINATSGLIIGSPCVGGNQITTVQPTKKYPFIQVNAILNKHITESWSFVFNLNYLLTAESVFFTDQVSQTQETGLMITLQDTALTKIMINLPYNDLFQILQPTQI